MKKIFLFFIILLGCSYQQNDIIILSLNYFNRIQNSQNDEAVYKAVIIKNQDQSKQIALYQKNKHSLTKLYSCDQSYHQIYIFYLQKINKTIIIDENTKALDNLVLVYENKEQKLNLTKNSTNMFILDYDDQIITIKDSYHPVLYTCYLEVYI